MREIFFSKCFNFPYIAVTSRTGTYSFQYKGKIYNEKIMPKGEVWNAAIQHVLEVYEFTEEELQRLKDALT